MLSKFVVEAIGTFFLVLTIGLVVIEPGAGALAPVAIGSVLMVMVYAGGHVSGAHYNPAVTLAVLLRGLTDLREAMAYWVAQVLAGLAAAFVVLALKPDVIGPALAVPAGSGLAAEFLFTFALCWVVLNAATARGTEGNSFYGLAIGFTVLAGAFAVGPISGGAFNPAVSAGVIVMGLSTPASLWVYLVAQLAAGAAAALVFNAVVRAHEKPTTATAAERAGLEPAGRPGPD